MQVKEAVMDISNLYTRGWGVARERGSVTAPGPGPGLLCHYVYYSYYNLGVACGGRGTGHHASCAQSWTPA